MKLVVTVYERTVEDALRAIRSLDRDHDMVEVRFDAFGGGPAEPFRNVSVKPVILTNRGGEPVDADFGLIDVEFGRAIRDPQRTILSFHDFDRMPDLEPLTAAMLREKCRYTKIAVTPQNLRDNEVLLAALRPGLTLFGMGERGMYSRILAPFFGSELSFVAVDDVHAAAPGQITLDSALAIYGTRDVKRPEHVFAIVGNPAGHSLSPTIHNPLFRDKGVSAAYTIASFESFDEAVDAPLTGMSVTAPFKDDAFAYAQRINADIGVNALDARAVNTIVRTKTGIIADNTDVDGFEALLRGKRGKKAAVFGAGGTAR
ncbi:MAG TPA: type I 3-dehydroquinate dehydratase, partial [Thermoanaerobaculia bacterium]|nr:type I 3-dehydroquinate dehydratase [Thermoanaerobaculia bacterium]